MTDTSARRVPSDFSPELLQGFRELEGRFPTEELAGRVVRAALMQPGISGARLWRIDRGSAEMWAEEGTLPPSGDRSVTAESGATGADPTLWTAALGSDEVIVSIKALRRPVKIVRHIPDSRLKVLGRNAPGLA